MGSQEKTEPPRRPLQNLPAMPLNKRPQAIATPSSPLETMNALKFIEPMTPPATPLRPQYSFSTLSPGSIPLSSVNEEDPQDFPSKETSQSAGNATAWETTIPRPNTHCYRLHSHNSCDSEYGRGVWSIVHRAHAVASPSSAPPTPPNSPPNGAGSDSHTLGLVALKTPTRRDAHKILDHEARILTYLHSFPGANEYLVPFHGYDGPAHSILLEPIPLNLDAHAKSCAKNAKANFSTRTMFDPVIGSEEWMNLGRHLISGLAFLHQHDCIHGDVKPANILLRCTDSGYEPVYCDFSSSAITSDNTTEITALTPDYSAPELLSCLTSRGIPTLPTREADVYALGVTLLFAATGESPYACARMEVQKLSMAREGKPIEFARNGEQAARVRKCGVVEAIVGGAVKRADNRWTVETWLNESKRVLAQSS